ncbi:MAG: histidine phosphatase family protein [Paracoccus sp. (in: a-proteobacteria)]|uniref:histidine phosphatase family protein n=1 Tax=Paracoccus sp. TaxID=267 RepID=UPI0026DF7C28|nr:histidine phosphatase family protein [Paracoccus sp. (in: a-proteobacteria)]MDO5622584.1 histidine phosphatase family protein [Paracoccus sp. (in: a-proteobacteria)]
MIHPFPLYLLRHGETEWNRQGRLQGRLDSPLTVQGRKQAEQQAATLAGITAPGYASPQGRAQDTARIILGPDFITDPRLVEIDVGDFTGARLDDLHRDHPGLFHDWLGWYDQTPNGEHFAALAVRCRAFLDDLTGPAVVVTHGVTLRMLRVLALGQGVAKLGDLPLRQGQVYHVEGGQHRAL